MSTSFTALLRREWMQHHRGWAAMMAAPPLLLLLAVVFAPRPDHPLGPALTMMITCLAVTGMGLAVAWLFTAFQLPGLARRDQQDRSIEFWLSLPTSPAASVGATLLMHGLLVPLAAVAFGALASILVGLVVVASAFGVASWAELPGWTMLAAGVAGTLRLAFGACLATLWVAPLALVLMVASALLKRWGVPAVVALVGIGGEVLRRVYGLSIVGDTLRGLVTQAGHAMVFNLHREPAAVRLDPQGDNAAEVLGLLPSWAWRDALDALAALAQPLFVFSLLASVACFWALVALRRRGGR